MPFGTLRATFYNTSGVSTGVITDVVDAASPTHQKNKPGSGGYVLLPHQISAAQRAYIISGGLCHVEIEQLDNTGVFVAWQPFACFVVGDSRVEQQGVNTYLRVEGSDKMSILSKWTNSIYLTAQEPTGGGTAQNTTENTITLQAGTPDRTGWTVAVPFPTATQQVIIESHDTGSQVATLAYDWDTEPPNNTSYFLHQGAATTVELARIDTEIEPFVSGGWTLDVEAAYQGTANGTYNVIRHDSALRVLQLVQEQAQGEFFRLAAPYDTSLEIHWRRNSDTSGVNFTDNPADAEAGAYIIPGTMRITEIDRKWTRIFPTGAGMGDNALTLSGATINPATLYAGFALVTVDGLVGIKNGNIETGSFQRSAQKMFPEIQSANDVATQNTAAANALLRAAAYWLSQNSGSVKRYEFSCYTMREMLPGQQINLTWTDPGKNALTVSETGLYIQSVRHRLVNGQRYTDVVLTETLEDGEDNATQTQRHVRAAQSHIRRANATSGTSAVGGGAIGAHDHAYLPLIGGALTGPVTTTSTIDGVDISARDHDAVTVASSTPSGALTITNQALTLNINGSNVPTHDIITKHSYVAGGNALDVVGLSASSTLAMLTPSSDVSGGVSAILKSDSGSLTVDTLTVWESRINGEGSLIFGIGGNQSIFVGNSGGVDSSTTAYWSVGIGFQALDSIVDGDQSIAIGARALRTTTGATRTLAIGTRVMELAGNVADVIGIGYETFSNLVSGSRGVGIGSRVGIGLTTGSENVIIGYEAGQGLTWQSDNTIIGSRAGSSATTYSSVLIGKSSGSSITDNNVLCIANSATTNPLIYGKFPNTIVTLAAASLNFGDSITSTTIDGRGHSLLVTEGTDLSGEGWASGYLGSQWGIDTGAGHADFRSIYADELRVTAFIAEGAFVRAGSQYITKSMTTVTADFVVPSVGNSAYIYVADIDGQPDTAVFEQNDYILLRLFDRSGGGLSALSVWGQVTSYLDQANGVQRWWFTTRSASAGAVGAIVSDGSVALDFGSSGDGYIVATAIDAAGAPYEKIATWKTNPYTSGNITEHARWGNLNGIAGIANEYGYYTGISPTGPRIIATDTRLETHGMKMSLYDGGDNGLIYLFTFRVDTDLNSDVFPNGDITYSNVAPTANIYQQINNTSTATSVRNGNNSQNGHAWLDMGSITTGMTSMSFTINVTVASFVDDNCTVTAQLFRSDGITPLTDEVAIANQASPTYTQRTIKVTGFDSAAAQSVWDDARVKIQWYYHPSSSNTEVIRIDPFVPSLAIGNPLPTGLSDGDGLWAGLHSDGYYKFRVGTETGQQLRWDGLNLRLMDAAGNNTIIFQSSGNARFDGVIEIGTNGGIWQGSGAFASPTTGLKMWNDSGVGRIAGYNSGTLQAGFGTDGKLTAGGGKAVMDANGVGILVNNSEQLARSISFLDENASNYEIGRLTASAQASTNYVWLKGLEQASHNSFVAAEAYAPTTRSATSQLISYYDLGGGAQKIASVSVEAFASTARVAIGGYMRLAQETVTPANPPSNANIHIYPKGGKLVFQYNDGGTVRYKYLDLTGTGVTWVHTTTAP